MNTLRQLQSTCELAKTLSAEDIRSGDVVAVLDRVYEYPSFLWDRESHVLSPDQPVCIRLRGPCSGRPWKVKAICLPYLLVKSPNGTHATLDVRQCRLVRLSAGYARKAWKRFRKAKKCSDDDGC